MQASMRSSKLDSVNEGPHWLSARVIDLGSGGIILERDQIDYLVSLSDELFSDCLLPVTNKEAMLQWPYPVFLGIEQYAKQAN